MKMDEFLVAVAVVVVGLIAYKYLKMLPVVGAYA